MKAKLARNDNARASVCFNGVSVSLMSAYEKNGRLPTLEE
jgi:hypothetical protein